MGRESSTARSTDSGLPPVPSQISRGCSGRGTMKAFSRARPRDALVAVELELLNEHGWATRQQLAQAIFEWIEAWYNPRRRHSYCKMLSPVDHEAAHAAA